MKEIGLLLLGWILGLAGPLVVKPFTDRSQRNALLSALWIELEDLRFRLAISSLSLLQRHGELNTDFLNWLTPIVDSYTGTEPASNIRELVNKMKLAKPEDYAAAVAVFRAKPGVASSIKTFQASFLESHLLEISQLPVTLQRKIHAFRSQLSILNQEIALIEPRILMTFSSSLSDINSKRLSAEIDNRMMFVQQRCRYAAESIEPILKEIKP